MLPEDFIENFLPVLLVSLNQSSRGQIRAATQPRNGNDVAVFG